MKNKKTEKVIKKDISEVGNAELSQFIFNNHAPYYKGENATLMFTVTLTTVYYSQDEGYAFPSVARFAEKLGTDERTVQRYIKKMREAVDETGQPLWTILSAKDNGGFGRGNHYIPNFVYRAADSELNKAIKKQYGIFPVTDENETEEIAEAAEPQTDAEGTEQHDDYVFVSLPETFAKDPDEMFEFMIPYGIKSFSTPDAFADLNASQQDFIGIMVSYLVASGHIQLHETSSTANLMANTWAKHPETSRDVFYNRFMAHQASKSA